MNKRNLSCGQIVSFYVLVFVLIALGVSTTARAESDGTLNSLVDFKVLGTDATSYTEGCSEGTVGTFIINARLKNTSTRTHSKLVAEVTELTNGNILKDVDFGSGGAWSRMTIPEADSYLDGALSPGEYVDVTFEICLSEWEQFSFKVNVLGESVGLYCDYQASVEVEIVAGLSVINIPLGETVNLGYTVRFNTTSPENISQIEFSHEVSPDAGGLTSFIDSETQWITDKSNFWLVDVTFIGNAVGTYEVKTHARISECAESDEVLLTINVVTPKLNCVTSLPSALHPSTGPAKVFFTTDLMGKDVFDDDGYCLDSIRVFVEQVDKDGNVIHLFKDDPLKDDGGVGDGDGDGDYDYVNDSDAYPVDLSANDGVYSGSITIDPGDEEGILYFRTRAFVDCVDEEVVSSCVQKIFVTNFTIGIPPETEDKTVCVIDEDGYPILDKGGNVVTDFDAYPAAEKFVCDEVLVQFKEGTDSINIKKIVDEVGGQISGTVFDYGMFIVKLEECDCPTGVNNALKRLSKFSEVVSAGKNGVGTGSGLIPTEFTGNWKGDNSWGQRQVGADVAWERLEINKESQHSIVFLDSGINSNHPDLFNRVTGINSSLSEPLNDEYGDAPYGHGTPIAGIAAAEGNNGVGTAGMSWRSEILSMKVLRNNKTWDEGSFSGVVSIVTARGYKLVNFSGGGYVSQPFTIGVLEKLREQGVLFVTTLSNERGTPSYPGGLAGLTTPSGVKLDNVLVVGGTNDQDRVAVWSALYPDPFANRDLSHSIYAPGENIYTTTKNGDWASVSFGNSYAAGFVSGAAAAIWDYVPTTDTGRGQWERVKSRLIHNAVDIPIAGDSGTRNRLDFGKVVEGLIQERPEISFENGDLEDREPPLRGWKVEGLKTGGLKTKGDAAISGDIVGASKTFMHFSPGALGAYASTGSALANAIEHESSSLSQEFTVPAGVTKLLVKFDYAFISDEFARYPSDEGFYDDFKIYLEQDGAVVKEFASGRTDDMFSDNNGGSDDSKHIEGFRCFHGARKIGSMDVDENNMVGWRRGVSGEIDNPTVGATYRFVISIHDRVDAAYESRVYVDNVTITPQ